MKIEMDHEELSAVLQHLREDRDAGLKKILQFLEPGIQVGAQLAAERLSKPRAVADPEPDQVQATGTDDA